jgi:hypothetical protein
MLSTPWNLGFVLAAIVGAMLVPGCRTADNSSGARKYQTHPLLSSTRATSSGLKAISAGLGRGGEAADRPETPPDVSNPVESADPTRP